MPEHDDAQIADSLLDAVLTRSTELQDALIEALRLDETYELGAPVYGVKTSFLAAELSLEHGSAVRMLLATGHPRSATGAMRMQYEAMVRSAWALWAATDDEIDLLEQEPTPESEAAAK